MVFNSLTFIYLCLIPCLILVLLLEVAFRNRGAELSTDGQGEISKTWESKVIRKTYLQNIILLMFSFSFFAWSSFSYLKLILALIVLNYLFGLIITGLHKTGSRPSKTVGKSSKISSKPPKTSNIIPKMCLAAGIILNLLVLVRYKYFDMIGTFLNSTLGTGLRVAQVIPPLGISFITFSSISYLVDISRKNELVEKDPIRFSLYLMFFPKFAQGPIVKFKDMAPMLRQRSIAFDSLIYGLERFIFGMSKKVLLADILAQTSRDIFSDVNSGMDLGTAWIGILSYTLCLYMDFSGYSDMAIGIGRMTGFEFEENFNFPYNSLSPSEFWRRWHISLGDWFREYLYIPLGGSKKGNVYLNLLIVFIATGIWHGSGSIYLLWGIYHGIFVILSRVLERKGLEERIPKVVRWVLTFLMATVGWIAFNVKTPWEFFKYIWYMLGMGEAGTFSWIYYVNPRLVVIFAIIGLGCLILPRINSKALKEDGLESREAGNAFALGKYALLVLLLAMCFVTTLSEGYQPFLYFQF